MGILTEIKKWFVGEQKPEAPAVPVYRPHIAIPPSSDSAPPTETRPKIAISAADAGSKSLAAMLTLLRSTGADPVVIVDHDEHIRKHGGVEKAVAATMKGVSGLVVLGNDQDMPPETYGEKAHPKTKSLAVNDDGTPNVAGIARRTFEKLAMKQALESNMPLLGVCGGMQSINVDGGGSLHQHVPDLVGDNHHMQSDNNVPPFVPVQFVKIMENTHLSAIAGATPGLFTPGPGELPADVIMENSFHHQAVKEVRPDFRITAISEDGIVEGMEPKPDNNHPDRWAQFVQFHPEFGASDLGTKLATSLTGAAKAYAVEKPAQPEKPELIAEASAGKMAAMILQRRQNAVMQL